MHHHHHVGPASGDGARHLCRWPWRLPILSMRAWTALLMFMGLTVIFPLFFTDKIRQMNVIISRPVIFNGPPLEFQVPSFKKQPRDRVAKAGLKYSLEPNVCPGDASTHPYLVLFIPSRPGYAEERAAVRETWGVHARLCSIRIVFGFGSFESDDLFYAAQTENSIYGDLLQTSTVIDAYHNQTRLVLSFLEWGAAHCQGAKFIGKADEDTWINIFGVLKYLQLPEANENAVIGHILYDEVVKRLPEQKWFLTLAEYPNDTYPPFAVGQLYIFPVTSIDAVLQAAKKITIHWLDDVFIGGQVPHLLKMKLIHIRERTNLWEVSSLPCFGRKYFIIHATPADKKREVYYNPCMESYRQGTCQAQLDAQTVPYQEPEILDESATTSTAGELSTVTRSSKYETVLMESLPDLKPRTNLKNIMGFTGNEKDLPPHADLKSLRIFAEAQDKARRNKEASDDKPV